MPSDTVNYDTNFQLHVSTLLLIFAFFPTAMAQDDSGSNSTTIAIAAAVGAGLCVIVACTTVCKPRCLKKKEEEEIQEEVRVIPIGTNVPMNNAAQSASQFWEEEKPKSAAEIFEEGEQASKDHRSNLESEKARKKAQLEARLQARKKKKNKS